MVVMVIGLIVIWILQLPGAAFGDVGRRCFASALDTVVRAAVSKTELTSSLLLLLRSTLGENRHAGNKMVYSAIIFANDTGGSNVCSTFDVIVLYCRTLTATRPAIQTIRLFIISMYNVQPIARFLPCS